MTARACGYKILFSACVSHLFRDKLPVGLVISTLNQNLAILKKKNKDVKRKHAFINGYENRYYIFIMWKLLVTVIYCMHGDSIL